MLLLQEWKTPSFRHWGEGNIQHTNRMSAIPSPEHLTSISTASANPQHQPLPAVTPLSLCSTKYICIQHGHNRLALFHQSLIIFLLFSLHLAFLLPYSIIALLVGLCPWRLLETLLLYNQGEKASCVPEYLARGSHPQLALTSSARALTPKVSACMALCLSLLKVIK